MAKEPIELKWIEDLLSEQSYIRKSMFGGFAYYRGECLVLALFESQDSKWQGVLFPIEREFHARARESFPFLKPHSILTKWLYLPMASENFEDQVQEVVRAIKKPGGYWGVIPKAKPKSGSRSQSQARALFDSKSSAKIKTKDAQKAKFTNKSKLDTKKPSLFSDEPVRDVLKKAKKVSDLKNLGPVSEAEFAKIGIVSAQQFIRLGWKKTMKKLVELNPKNRHSLFAYALIGALTNTEYSRISETQKNEAKAFVHSLPRQKKNRSK